MDRDTEEIVFENRVDAGRRLASRLEKYRNRKDVIVLGIPRGGVPVAFRVSREEVGYRSGCDPSV